MNPIINWLIQSTWFKKYSGVTGGFCLGLWVAANYHTQIKEVLIMFGISKSTFMDMLLGIIGAAGIATSIGLSVVKNQKIKKIEKKNKEDGKDS